MSPSNIEKGVFRIVRELDGPRIHLFPGSSLRGSAVTACPADVRARRADQRARELAMLLKSGAARNQAELARIVGLSRVRISQILARLKAPTFKVDREHAQVGA